ncbi:hypothetical protein Glove_52g25 [Diversispora epigaea]|uniref:AGC-kinase C-terminal domain-containing protein n=1 Tax=Diversispora epigaea TaxID=1348612 RepID=A0A397JGK0_9GLOM|nr:hypothetical protein Glove_52g25 [Diversispora epigaea]
MIDYASLYCKDTSATLHTMYAHEHHMDTHRQEGQSPFRRSDDDEDEIFDAILEDEILYPLNMSWDSKVPPPLYPLISSPADTFNFDDESTKELPVLTPVNSHLTKDCQGEFCGFHRSSMTKKEDEILIRAVDLYGKKNWQQGLNNLYFNYT